MLSKNEKPINESVFQFLLQFAPPEKRARILRQKVKHNADNMLVGAALVKYMILREFHIPISGQVIAYVSHGKPYLKDYSDVHFNISHSGQFVSCVVCDKPVGIDVQEIMPYCTDIAKKVCSAKEISPSC